MEPFQFPTKIGTLSDGKVKVLDFGLAKAFGGDAAETSISDSPTVSIAATQKGVILGTPTYMSPEQARGKPLDKRADIWAFGCVLYEMLTGQRAFGGKEMGVTLAKVINAEPEWDCLPAGLNRRVRELVERCLSKESKDRCRDVGDARLEIKDALSETLLPVSEPPRSWPSRAFVVSTSALAVLVLVIGFWSLTRTSSLPGLETAENVNKFETPGFRI